MIKYFISFIGIFALTPMVLGQCNTAETVTQAFRDEGFENIQVATREEEGEIIASYDNRSYRWFALALNSARQILAANLSHYQNLVLIPQDHAIPQFAIRFGRSDTLQDYRISYNIKPEWQVLQNIQRFNPSDFKFEIVLYPQIYIQNTTFEKIYETQLNLAPELSLLLWRGLRLSGQVIFPFHNDLDYAGNFIRPGIITFSHYSRWPMNFFSSLNAGNFTNNRYGIDLRLKKMFETWPVGLTANLGYTGISSFVRHTWYYSQMNVWTWQLRGYAWYQPLHMLLGIDYARYLELDRGIRLDCTRFWRETAVGFYAVRTNSGFNGGFHFSLSLSGNRIARMTFVNARLPKYFDWQYNARTREQIGQIYETVPDADYTDIFMSIHYQEMFN